MIRTDGWYPPSDGDDIGAEVRQAGETAAVIAILLASLLFLLLSVSVALWGPDTDTFPSGTTERPTAGQAWTR